MDGEQRDGPQPAMVSPESLRTKINDEEMNFLVSEFLNANFLSNEWERCCSEIESRKGSPEERINEMITLLRAGFKYKLFWKLRDIVNDDLMDERSWVDDLESRLTEICDGEKDMAALLGRMVNGLIEKIKSKFAKASVKLYCYHKPGLPDYIFEQEMDGEEMVIHLRFHEESMDVDFREKVQGFDYGTLDPDVVIECIGKFLYKL